MDALEHIRILVKPVKFSQIEGRQGLLESFSATPKLSRGRNKLELLLEYIRILFPAMGNHLQHSSKLPAANIHDHKMIRLCTIWGKILRIEV